LPAEGNPPSALVSPPAALDSPQARRGKAGSELTLS